MYTLQPVSEMKEKIVDLQDNVIGYLVCTPVPEGFNALAHNAQKEWAPVEHFYTCQIHAFSTTGTPIKAQGHTKESAIRFALEQVGLNIPTQIAKLEGKIERWQLEQRRYQAFLKGAGHVPANA